ncbi:TetR family transcriptional regulator [Patulibacter brassicae]|uniref:TetR family transcriptional regulator n=1 Tax=Patulibacter brassicae TaxID=1705717 RepID=A0ABU4VHP1_9ACTN|nr:TetR family transcriptional regulator [Patulibacter brassicae]MDX8151330.1 TetR family transcriptional regulator [Patulibacter brassicae]
MARTTEPATDRRDRLLDEALRLLAAGGLQAVTHRAVESAAGVPHGSVTYWFASRDGLVEAMVDRLAADCERRVRDLAHDVALAAARRGPAIDVGSFARALMGWMDDGREQHVARLELELAAVRDPRLAERMTDAALVFWRLCEPIVVAAGSRHPQRDGRAMAAMVDGLLLDRLAHRPAGAEVVEAALAHLLGDWSGTPERPSHTGDPA